MIQAILFVMLYFFQLTCFVLYLRIIITFLKNDIRHLKENKLLSKELTNGIEIIVSQSVFKLWIKIYSKMSFRSITQPLGLAKF